MHEASLMRGLMTRLLVIAGERGAERVVGLTVRLGALSHMSPEHFREHFNQAAAGTLAAGADVRCTVETDILAANAVDVMLESIEIE